MNRMRAVGSGLVAVTGVIAIGLVAAGGLGLMVRVFEVAAGR